MIGAELMARAIQRQGVRTVFGLPGHLEILFGALDERGIRLIHQRHESAVVLSADGYARVRGDIGVACVTAGPGLANALGGLATAYEACTPLLLICGRNEFSLLDVASLQEMDHPRAVRSMTKQTFSVHDASRLGEYVDMACRVARSGRPGPVLLEVPRNCALGRVDENIAALSLQPLVRAERPHPDVRSIERAAGVLVQSERPMVIAGNGAYWGAAGAGLRRLAGELGLPVLGKSLARGLVPEDMQHGFPWPVAYPAARHADAVVVAGARIAHPIAFGAPPFFRDDVRFIQIDIDGAEIGRNRRVEAPVVGDCGPAVEALADELSKRGYRPRPTAWLHEAILDKLARIDGLGREEKGMVHPLRMARELARRMPPDAIFVGDGANAMNWYKAVLRIEQSPGWLDYDPFGCMGVGLPLAIGAVAAQQETGTPRPVFLGAGDGAFGQYLGELATASLHRLPMFIMVANDGGWGASRNIELRVMGRTVGVDFNQSRYELVAQGLECYGESAACPGEVGPAFDRALEAVRNGRPAVVNVLVDRDSGNQRSDPL
ncbi:MAG: thiamine pyrophosphate-binding protein, partial [Chloroflexota bacterium]|nr:thiamine pyrophosphate-binding protein [Chloroflexota bacterium]